MDIFANHAGGLDSPYQHAFAVTPSDDDDLEVATRGLYVGVSGDIKMTMVGGETVTRLNVAAGITHRWRIVKIFASDTDATDMIGEY